jgi:hypothetical protein
MPKITFTMSDPSDKKHSTRFDFEKLEESNVGINEKWNPSFYIPKPFAVGAARLRVTIEVIE